jgi:hypothetical protein
VSLRPVLAVGLADLAARLAPHVTPASIGAAPASRFRTGTGSPEGVVTAPVGTTYKDTATGNEWHKMSGTGVTGWRGPIVLSDDPAPGRLGHHPPRLRDHHRQRLHRRANPPHPHRAGVLSMSVIALTRTTVGSGYQRILVPPPTGYRPISTVYFRPLVGASYGYLSVAELTLSGAGLNENFTLTWLTRDPLPVP